jgi:hypothetical protein
VEDKPGRRMDSIHTMDGIEGRQTNQSSDLLAHSEGNHASRLRISIKCAQESKGHGRSPNRGSIAPPSDAAAAVVCMHVPRSITRSYASSQHEAGTYWCRQAHGGGQEVGGEWDQEEGDPGCEQGMRRVGMHPYAAESHDHGQLASSMRKSHQDTSVDSSHALNHHHDHSHAKNRGTTQRVSCSHTVARFRMYTSHASRCKLLYAGFCFFVGLLRVAAYTSSSSLLHLSSRDHTQKLTHTRASSSFSTLTPASSRLSTYPPMGSRLMLTSPTKTRHTHGAWSKRSESHHMYHQTNVMMMLHTYAPTTSKHSSGSAAFTCHGQIHRGLPARVSPSCVHTSSLTMHTHPYMHGRIYRGTMLLRHQCIRSGSEAGAFSHTQNSSVEAGHTHHHDEAGYKTDHHEAAEEGDVDACKDQNLSHRNEVVGAHGTLEQVLQDSDSGSESDHKKDSHSDMNMIASREENNSTAHAQQAPGGKDSDSDSDSDHKKDSHTDMNVIAHARQAPGGKDKKRKQSKDKNSKNNKGIRGAIVVKQREEGRLPDLRVYTKFDEIMDVIDRFAANGRSLCVYCMDSRCICVEWHVCFHGYVCLYVYMQKTDLRVYTRSHFDCVCIRVCVCMYVWTYTLVWLLYALCSDLMCVCVYVCMYICIYIYMYICIYIYIYT